MMTSIMDITRYSMNDGYERPAMHNAGILSGLVMCCLSYASYAHLQSLAATQIR